MKLAPLLAVIRDNPAGTFRSDSEYLQAQTAICSLLQFFIDVQRRGGYYTVTETRQWLRICKRLNINPSKATSASHSLRSNYEKYLLDFEQYMLSGQYEKDRTAGTLPSSSKIMPTIRVSVAKPRRSRSAATAEAAVGSHHLGTSCGGDDRAASCFAPECTQHWLQLRGVITE